jgi:hypothetical protein
VKPSSPKAIWVLEAVAVSAAAVFYISHWWPVPIVGVIVALICVLVSSLPIWARRYRAKRYYAPVLQCTGFGMLIIASLQEGRSGVPFAIGFGILFARGVYRAFLELPEG